ncbi:ABC transporter, partial [Pseudomonas oryzihabitans]
QQKVIIGRWVAADAKVFLFDEPTRGIDIGAKAEIYNLIERLAQAGKAIVVVSSEMTELLRIADRVLVMREGRITQELSGDAITEENIARFAIKDLEAA